MSQHSPARAPRLTLRDFEERDRAPFVAYQLDRRYRALYDLDDDPRRPNELFDLFLRWQTETPRNNLQLGIFDASGELCGCAGLRLRPDDPGSAVMGIELAPAQWGRYRVAVDAIAALLTHGFTVLRLDAVVGQTSTGNTRVERLARFFGARVTGRRDGDEWMTTRGWQELDWTIRREAWEARSEAVTSGFRTSAASVILRPG